MTIQERIKQYIDYKGITPYKFCKDLEFSMGSLNKKGVIGTDKYLKIIKYYTDLNPDWLLTGEGNMFKEETVQEEVSANENELITLLREKVKDKEMIIKEKTKNIELLEERLKELKEQVKQLSRQKVSAPSVNYGPFPSVPSL